jgi:hypothetical protein
VYKTLLVNCEPKVLDLYSNHKLWFLRQGVIDVAPLITDLDGDSLTFELGSSTDTLALSKYGLVFDPVLKRIIGTPTRVGVLPLITVKATDVHGASANAYLTITILDFSVHVRKVEVKEEFPKINNKNVTEQTRFFIQIDDDIFYSIIDRSPLVLYATD